MARLDDKKSHPGRPGLARTRAGIDARLRVAGRDPSRVSTSDLGIVAGPRLNAAEALTDRSVGIECLLARYPNRAAELSKQLDSLAGERRDIEAGLQETALAP